MPTLTTRGVAQSGTSRSKSLVKTITASATLSPGDAGVVLVNLSTSATATLPSAARAGRGATYTIVNVVATASGTGTFVDLTGTDTMVGNGFTAAAGKGAVNTQATSRAGDAITVVSDGVSAWYIVSLTGTWAREA